MVNLVQVLVYLDLVLWDFLILGMILEKFTTTIQMSLIEKKNKKFKDVIGTMVVDIGVVQNGKVSSFFKVESDYGIALMRAKISARAGCTVRTDFLLI